MAEGLTHTLTAARSRWMIGGEGVVANHPLLAGASAAEADLRLLAVAGQYQRFVQPPQPPVLNLRPDLPVLSMPFLPNALRPLVRRLLLDKSDRAPLWLAIFAARRGHVLHPADWMPPPNADLPAVYRPLQAWAAGQTGPVARLSSETWLDLTRAERLVQFAALRQADPVAALALLSDHLAPCPAEERLALVEALAKGLTSDDAAFLHGLASDRSDKVRKAAVHLLARLGQSDADPLAAEAAAMFELATEGLIRRRKVLRLIAKAKEGQLRSLVQTLPEISLPGLAQALGLGASEFVALWQPDKVPQQVQYALSAMIARTATDTEVAAYWQKLMADPDIARTCLPQLFARLTLADQESACLWLIVQSGLAACTDVLTLMGAALSAPVSAALTAQRKALEGLVRLSRETAPEKAAAARADTQRLANILSILGLLLTASDANLVLQTVTAAGVHPADPMLDRLNLNAALKGS
ncbi:MAG: hypothetical protein RLZZ437_2847 [Pseudomonadota bacterium]